MAKQQNPPRILLPRDWPRQVKSAMLHVVSLAQYAMAYTSSWAVNSKIAGRSGKTFCSFVREFSPPSPVGSENAIGAEIHGFGHS